MRKYNIIAIGLASVMLMIGFLGMAVNKNKFNDRLSGYEYMSGNTYYDTMAMYGGNNNWQGHMGDFKQGVPSGHMMGGMHSAYAYPPHANTTEVMDLDVLKESVKSYLLQYDTDLEISEVFIYENSEYYFSIIEKSTGRGAMELLVNQYAGNVYPEFGPNMMWNLKYGRHGQNSRGMMGSFARVNNNSYDTNVPANDLSLQEAHLSASDYLIKNISKTAQVSQEAHEFYGYYTFHIEENKAARGMLSVNGFTGEVWYHDWHGDLLALMEGHDD